MSDARSACLPLPQLASLLAQEGLDLLVVREPQLDDRRLFELVLAVVTAVRGTGARVLVNDRIDIALAAGADGVHLKSSGPDPRAIRAATRAALGAGAAAALVVGQSCHAAGELAAAARSGDVDHAFVGPAFATPGKAPLGADGLSRLLAAARGGSRLDLPWLALGGITPSDVASIGTLALRGESWGVAAVRALQDPPGEAPAQDRVREAARAFRRELAARENGPPDASSAASGSRL